MNGLEVLATPIEYLKGVGPQKAEVLKKEAGIHTFEDLLLYFPYRHIDRSEFQVLADVNSDTRYYQIKGFIQSHEKIGMGAKTRTIVYFTDGVNNVQLVWFRDMKWLTDTLKPKVEYVLFGKASYFNGSFSFNHPDLDLANSDKLKTVVGLQPLYNSTEKMKLKSLDSKGLIKLTAAVIDKLKPFLQESLPNHIIEKHKLNSRRDALCNIHFPDNKAQLDAAIRRLKFEELFFFQFQLMLNKHRRNRSSRGFIFEKVGQHFNQFYSNGLQFDLTNAQKRVLREIRENLRRGTQMNRLLQGDVGSGKTIVAFMAMLIAIDNNFQACIMAPTEILANQHFSSIEALSENLPIKIGLLTGSTKKKERNAIFESIAKGDLHILVGTHALIEPTVVFKNLGLAVIDEQHKFGVEQRAQLYKKNSFPPHILAMSATPIPRTLSMTQLCDLDISIIDEMPLGRKPIHTVHQKDAQRLKVFGFMRQQIALGRQIYVIYPLIQESEKLDLKFLEDGFIAISRAFPLPQYQVSIVHGKMPAKDKAYEMQRFVAGITNIMVSTTVIEVGVNVPNATVMIIENAERFGLAQLHQLRGRVGRGAQQSYCILMTADTLSYDGHIRIKTMTETNDGFKIAETDLLLRGPGDITGTQQSGEFGYRIANIIEDRELIEEIYNEIETLLTEDVNMQLPKNELIAARLKALSSSQGNWIKIS